MDRATGALVPADIVVREPSAVTHSTSTANLPHTAPTIVTTSVSQQQSSSSSSTSIASGQGSITTQATIERLSRPMAFDKMESLVREMQDTESGVPVRSQKLFLTSIPSVFMGYDLVDWLMERLGVEECEALNIAFQLCLHGYLFPVSDWKNLFVKDDSTFYRFQTPYYWPWQQKPPDNVEYAIYLAKRSLRNKQKHGLEDYELEALNSLHKNLKGKWEFITMQAEEQIKLAKERKKGDKVVSDSQERAYWRVHRPPPGQFTPLEACPVPSRGKPRKRNEEDLNREISMLKNSIGRNRMKMSQACECLVQYYETYTDYDPLMTPAQPSNPWVTEDVTYWQFSAPQVEVYSEKRVKKWAISIEDCVSDPMGLQEFTAYLKKEYSHENIRFWTAVNDLRWASQSSITRIVKEIYNEFLSPGAPCEINIDGKTMEQVQQGLKNPSRFAFDAAAEHVYALLLKKDCYPRFVRSDHYKTLLANAVQPSSKKSFFRFGGATKKKGSTSQPPNPGLLGQVTSQTTSVVGSLRGRRGSDRSLTGSAHELAVSGVKEATKVPHSHSQSNLNEMSYGMSSDAVSKFATKLEISIEVPSSSHAVCPWEIEESSSASEPSSIAHQIKPTVLKPLEPDIVSDVSDKMKRSCRLRQQNTLDSDFHSSKRLQPHVAEHRRASMTNATELSSTSISLRTTSLGECSKPLSEVATQNSPTAQKLAISASTPLLMIENKSIQSSTIPEESSRANSEIDLQRKLSSGDESSRAFNLRDKKTKSSTSASNSTTVCTEVMRTAVCIDTDKSSSQSSLPVINVTDNEGVTTEGLEDDENEQDGGTMETPSGKTEISVQTDKSVLQGVVAKTVEDKVEKDNEREEKIGMQQIEIEVETHAVPSSLEEQTLSEENMPKVIKKLSIQSEEQMLQQLQHAQIPQRQESDETQEELGEMSSDSFVPGYVAPAPTPAPSMAPLAEMDNDPEIDDESDEVETAKPIEPKIVCETQKKEKRRKKEKKPGESSSSTAKKSEPVKGNPVCPWEDEDDNTAETPFVKTYATLGYL